MELLTLHGHMVKHKSLSLCIKKTWISLSELCVGSFDRKPIGWSISDKMNVSHTVIPAIGWPTGTDLC